MRSLFLSIMLMLALLPATLTQAAPPTLGGCQMFPADNAWNVDISNAAVHPLSNVYVSNINANGGDFVHPDFGENPSYGIPWTTVDGTQPMVPVSFDYDHDSDPGPYPIPQDAPIEGGGDRHVLVVETTNCKLYEMFASEYAGGADNAWTAGSGAIFDLNSNALRPNGWTSADAAGLPILPGLARCEEAMTGAITHALRFTVSRTQKSFIYPATHYASNYTDTAYPPMGLRFRLKANYDLSGFTGQSLAVAQALKQYGMILADNGSNWFISGETNPDCWNDDDLNQLKGIPGTAFEAIVSPAPPSAAGELVANSGFEGAGGDQIGGRQALSWKVKNATGEKRVCNEQSAIDGVYKTVAFDGYCAYLFKGVSGESGKIQQTIAVTTLASGDSLTLSAQANGKNVPDGAGVVSLKVKYTDQTKSKFSLEIGAGTFDYVPFTSTHALTKAPAKVKLFIGYTGTSGKLTVDNVSLTEVAAARLLPLP